MRVEGSTQALAAGVAGAVALTTIHQVAQRFVPAAPRMDVVGIRALKRGFGAAEVPPSERPNLFATALAGDIVFNSAYYSFATTWTRGLALGLAAGAGALMLPQRLGLGEPPQSDRLSNQVMTVSWYVAGGLAAACTAKWLRATRR